MQLKIKKGNHYPFPFYFGLPIWVKKNKPTSLARSFSFTESCLYDLKDEDQHDVNKLFGFSVGWHHKTSFRFGWRPNLEARTIEIVGYEYHDKIRKPTTHICNIELGKETYFLLSYHPKGKIEYAVYQKNTISNETTAIIRNTVNIKRKWGLGYTLGVYFGGNETAPHDIIIYCEKINADVA